MIGVDREAILRYRAPAAKAVRPGMKTAQRALTLPLRLAET
jgi:hypothetical protein